VENKMEDDMKVKLQEYGLTGRYESLTIINRIQSKVCELKQTNKQTNKQNNQ